MILIPMTRPIALSSVLLLFCLVAPAATQQTADLRAPAVGNATQQIRPAAIRSHMAFLADDLLEGRGTATRGYEIAAKYVAAQFEAIGLEPGVNGVWFQQQVPMRRSELIADGSGVEIVRPGGKRTKLAFGRDYVMGGDFRASTAVKAPVVFVGYGVTAPERGYDDYAGVDTRGKIVAYFGGAPASFAPEERAHYSSAPVKAENAAAHDAVGILRLWSDEDEKSGPWSRLVQSLGSISLFAWLESGAAHDEFPQIRGSARLGPAVSQALFTDAAVTYAEAQAKPAPAALPVQVRIVKKSSLSDLTGTNVVALLRGSDPALAKEHVVFSAHLDHLGIGEPVKGDAIYNGAIDNASGVASLIEIARAFAALPERPRRSLLFVAFTAEEPGLIGSDYFVHHPPVPLASIVADVNIDGTSMWPFNALFARGADHSTLKAAVDAAAAAVGLPVVPDPFPEQASLVRSDQYSFIRKSVPSLILGATRTAEARALALDWVKNRYHAPSDDMSQPLDFEAAARFTRDLFLIGYAVAQADERPRWNPGDFFGERFGSVAKQGR
jgi:peptidase M28-like protein